jgi:hypothetical protein
VVAPVSTWISVRPQEEEPVVEPPEGEPGTVIKIAAPPASGATSTEVEP